MLFIASCLSVSFQVGHVNSRYLYTGRWRLFMKVGAILIPPVFRYMKKQVNVSPAVFEDRTVLSVWQLDKVFFSPCYVAWYCFI